MAVAKSRKSHSAKGMKRSHQKLSLHALSKDQETGETHIRHHMTKSGWYRGKKVINKPEAVSADNAE